MTLPKRYDPNTVETRLQALWREAGIYDFSPAQEGPVFSIDTPPPTVSGLLHLGHCYSYSHTDFVARFWRMNGYNVFYPMGYDDNGLPTERLVERIEGTLARKVGRQIFIRKCLEVSDRVKSEYQEVWERLGLSVDWRYSYRTIDDLSRRTSQHSFLDLYRKGLAYRREAPAIFCPECGTAIAQAELNDLERESTFYTIAFQLEDAGTIAVATTRPELLPACVAVFVHSDDARFGHLAGRQVRVPHFGQKIPVLMDSGVDPDKGTGIVMCCTFGDTADVAWWYTHRLPLRIAIDREGRMAGLSGRFEGLPAEEARIRIVEALDQEGLLLGARRIDQSVRVHERCDTPVEYIVTPQWFIRVLDFKDQLLAAGAQVNWHPKHMQARYREWVKNLDWDWCISRQRYYGVPFPIWYCEGCGEIVLADEAELPVDPTEQPPSVLCTCGSGSFRPEEDVMDTWATSSLTPQIVGRWLVEPGLYEKVYPFSLRAQAHEIIRTWAFYTIVKSHHHFDAVPWNTAAISGWGLAPSGSGKISKSRGGGPKSPIEIMQQHSADAIRYWAASTGPGKDAIIDEEKIQLGTKLIIKLWNVARFGERFLAEYKPADQSCQEGRLSPADRWILARSHRLIRRVTALFRGYDYAAAKNETEVFFWRDLADNYLEMAKVRLYAGEREATEPARYTLYSVLLTTLKLFAPLIPYVTDEIYRQLFAGSDGAESIHCSSWPAFEARFENADVEAFGDTLVAIATAVRRLKSERNLSLGTQVELLQLGTHDDTLSEQLQAASLDIGSVTRAQQIEIVQVVDPGLERAPSAGPLQIALRLPKDR